MNCELNLDIDSYDLKDILKLFSLGEDFDAIGLKNAKKIVLKTHPDKSGLDKKYFLFFTKAYKILYFIHDFKIRGSCPNSTEYSLEDADAEKEELMGGLANNPNFNEMFNELFEKNKLSQEYSSTGHGDWLKSEEDIDRRVATRADMNQKFTEKKSELRAIVPTREVEEMQSRGFHDIAGEDPVDFGSDVFSTLAFEDLRKAHTETVVPVTEEDGAKIRFKSAEELRNHRAAQSTVPLSLQQARDHLGAQKVLQNQNDVQRAFKLAKQDEETRKKNDAWMSSFRQLKNS